MTSAIRHVACWYATAVYVQVNSGQLLPYGVHGMVPMCQYIQLMDSV
jgi:hypothetical protein